MWGRLAACAAVAYRRCPVQMGHLADGLLATEIGRGPRRRHFSYDPAEWFGGCQARFSLLISRDRAERHPDHRFARDTAKWIGEAVIGVRCFGGACFSLPLRRLTRPNPQE